MQESTTHAIGPRIAAGGGDSIAAGGSRSAADANPTMLMHLSTSTLGLSMTASSVTSPGVIAPGASTLSSARSIASSSVKSPCRRRSAGWRLKELDAGRAECGGPGNGALGRCWTVHVNAYRALDLNR